MKLFLFSICLLSGGVILAQGGEPEHVKIGIDTTSEVRCFPHIDRFYEGEIPISYLGDPEGIQASNGLRVISFCISYAAGNTNKTVPVKGNRIPEEIVREIYANSLGEMVFITNIVTLTDENKRIDLMPMHLVPVK